MSAGAAISWANQIAAVWLEGLIGGLAAVLIAGALCAVFGRALPAKLRCWLWWLMCARLALAAVGGFVGITGVRFSLPMTMPAPVREQWHRATAGSGTGANADPALNPAFSGAQLPTAAPVAAPRPTIAAYLLLLWGISILIALVLMGRDAWRLHRVLHRAHDISQTPLAAEMREIAVKMGVDNPPRLLESGEASSPFVAGFAAPVLVVPVGFAEAVSPEEARMALAHELAHLRRGDLYLSVVPLAARLLCACVPLLPAWICREWATAREADCDAQAMQATAAAPGVYSRLLLKIVRGDAAPLPTTLATLGATASFHTLHTRLHLIQGYQKVRAASPLLLILFACAAVGIAVPWRFAPSAPPAASAASLAPLTPLPAEKGTEDIDDIPAFQTRAGGDPDKQYLLFGMGKGVPPPAGGYRLLVVLPGGDGSAEFNYFVRRLRKRALGERYLVAELVAKRWDARQFDEVVWPTRTNPWSTMRFPTEQFVADVVRDVEARYPVDKRYVFTLAWASGGPAGYATSLDPASPIIGSFVAMSVFQTDTLPPLGGANGHRYFLLHPENARVVPVAVAKRAQTLLRQNGADVELVTYPGGYGWSGDVYAQVRRGIHHLEKDR